jgi:HEAT repeat protein
MPEGDINQAVELFKSRDPRKRRWAVELAADLGTPEAAALLVKALQDQSWSLREYAIGQSAKLGKPMVAPLCRLLNSGIWFSRAAAVQALKAIGDPGALGPLCQVACDTNRSVSQSAREAAWDILLGLDAEKVLSCAASMDREQRKGLADILKSSDPDLGRSISALEGEGSGEETEADPEALQRLRAALKAAAKQEPRGDDEEP